MTQSLRKIDHHHGAGYVASVTGDRQAKDAYFRTAADSSFRRRDAARDARSTNP